VFYNLPDLVAAIGVAQLERAHQFQAAQADVDEVAAVLREALEPRR
jgi:dTDP-4-amino-4,6-dideoxygalactose transaminase